MKVADYFEFVRETDQYADRRPRQRREIALYGLAGEIGSLMSAIKKCLLGEGGDQDWRRPNNEIIEEIGDIVWYCVSLSQIENPAGAVNILTQDIAQLKREISGDDTRGRDVRAALDPTKRDQFLEAADHFPSTKDMTFANYQELAFLTARTADRELLEVCIAVLSQHAAQLLRTTLPEVERKLNTSVADKPVNEVLGEIAWHLCAMASLFGISMNEILARNMEKIGFRRSQGEPTALHDEPYPEHEKFPRVFDVAFISVTAGKSRMYMDGQNLGDDLKDNAPDDDGYRFHDVFHLANAVHLGWSPVLRKLMKRKRKSDEKVDEIQDGARAQIVEELVVKAIHSEGERLAGGDGSGEVRHFADRSQISFRFLKQIHEYVRDLEVWQNQHWEWVNAIYDGASAYYQLHVAHQGTVTIDLLKRTMTFSPDVFIELKHGLLVGMGRGLSLGGEVAKTYISALEANACTDSMALQRTAAAKQAILAAIGLPGSATSDLDINLRGDSVSVGARGQVQEAMWAQRVVSFKLEFELRDQACACVAIALADPDDPPT